MYAERITHYNEGKEWKDKQAGIQDLSGPCAHVSWSHVLRDGVSPAVLIPAISHPLTSKAGSEPLYGDLQIEAA